MSVSGWIEALAAPEFVESLDWINTGGRTVRLSDLRGRLVLLDFWTYGCINCRHLQPRLRELEQRFADTLTVIGVHSGKFTHERITANLAAACDRQDVAHAVVNDRRFRVWRSYGVQAWPTAALLNTQGELIGGEPGEFPLEEMVRSIEAAASEAERRGTLNHGRDPIAEPQPRAKGTLRFPGRVLVDGDRLVISDTGHGRVLDCILEHGPLAHAHGPRARVVAEHDEFEEPQGLALLGGALYVADRAGQSVWRIGEDGERQRVLGTGELADRTSAGGPGPSVSVRSPWGLTSHRGSLIIGMAGSHQLWQLDPASLEAHPWAGTSDEELIDGPLDRALLAQPTGVASLGSGVAFADSESSAIRIAEEAAGVRTIVGRGLFSFGDRDGTGRHAQLQHAEDLAVHAGALAVADTYNDRLKRIDPATRESRAWEGEAGEAGHLREPSGISSDGATLVVADTGNHRIVVVGEGGSLSEVELT